MPLIGNVYFTGGISHESGENDLPSYAHSRFYSCVEKPCLEDKAVYNAGLTYYHRTGSGIFLDLFRFYRVTTALRASQAEGAAAQLNKTGQGGSLGFFTRFLRRGQVFVSVSYLDITRHAGSTNGEDPLRAEKPRTKSEFGVRFPLTGNSSVNLIGNLIGNSANGSPGQRRNALSGVISGQFIFDAIIGIKTGPFSTIAGITNLFDKRDSDPLLDQNGAHYNPGRNFFIQFTSRF